MNREDIIHMAREAGFVIDELSRQHQPKCIGFTHYLIDDELERFAAIVAAAAIKDAPDYKMGYADGVADEREACAMQAWALVLGLADQDTADIVLSAIRARGKA